jgi:hypothetical protein
MTRSPRTPRVLHQRALLFPVSDGPVAPWDSLTQRQQLECRRALRQILVAVAHHARGVADDHQGVPDPRPEGLAHD